MLIIMNASKSKVSKTLGIKRQKFPIKPQQSTTGIGNTGLSPATKMITNATTKKQTPFFV